MISTSSSDDAAFAAVKKLVAAPDLISLQAIFDAHADVLLNGRAEQILEFNATQIETEGTHQAAEFAKHWRWIASTIRTSRLIRDHGHSFVLLDGRAVEPQELIDLVLDAQGKTDPASMHLLIDGTRWMFEHPKNTLAPDNEHLIEANATYQAMHGAALCTRAKTKSGRTALDDLNSAVEALNQALKILTMERDPLSCALTHVDLCNALCNRAGGQFGRAAKTDFLAAISSVDFALTLLSATKEPKSFITAKCVRGATYRERALSETGQVAVDAIDQALSDFDEALRVSIAVQDSESQAIAHLNRGAAMRARASYKFGKEAVDDLSLSLSAYDDAFLAKEDPNSDLHFFARLQVNRGAALRNRSDWQPNKLGIDDLTEALSCYDSLLNLVSADVAPQLYLQAQANRASALVSRAQTLIGKSKLNDLTEGIKICETLLQQLTIEHNPQDYARFQLTRANALKSRAEFRSGQTALDDCAAATASYELALVVWTLEFDPQSHAKAQMNRSLAFLRLACCENLPETKQRHAFVTAREAAQAVLSIWMPTTELPNWLFAQRCIATACRGLSNVGGERAALEEALGAGRRGILGSSDATERTLLAQRISGLGDALGLLRLRSEDNAAAAFAAIGLGRGVQLSADLVMARLEVDPDLVPLREALRALQAGREDLARVEREVMILRGRGEQSRRMTERSDDESMATEALAEAEFARSQLSDLQAERATALSKFEAARSTYESGLSAAGLGLDPEPPSMEEIVDALPEGGVLAVPIPGADGDGGALLIVGRGPDGTPDAAWSELPGLSEDATQAMLFGESWTEGSDEDNLASGWFDAYNDLKVRLAKSGGLASPHGPAQTAFDRAVRAMGRQLWDLVIGPLDHALRAFGATPGAEVVMMPPGRLAALPLAAAHPEPETGTAIRPFLTDWALSLVPSPQALIAAAGRISALEATAGTQAARLLCVTTPKEFAPNPVADLVPRGTCRDIQGPDATPEEVRTALEGHRHVAFLCHGHWNPQEPESSGLALAGPLDTAGQETVAMLTVGDLQRPGVAKGNARSWLMMACETAPVGLDAPDEFAGLAVRLAGEVPAVTGTLYPVLMGHAAPMGRAVLALQMGPRRLSPAQALRQAQLTAMEGGTPALEALVAETIGPLKTAPAQRAIGVGAMQTALSNRPKMEMSLGMPRNHDARALFDDFEDKPATNEPVENPRTDGPNPDDWTTHRPAHWAAYVTYGQ